MTDIAQIPRTVCNHGHLLVGGNVYIHPKNGFRECRKCRLIRSREYRHSPNNILSPAMAEKVIDALRRGLTVNNIIYGRRGKQGKVDGLKIVDAERFRNHAKRFPEFQAVVDQYRERNVMLAQRPRGPTRVVSAPALPRQMWTDGHHLFDAVRRAVASVPWPTVRDDLISDMLAAIMEGTLRVEDAAARVRDFMRARSRQERFSVTSKWGHRSLDAPLFDDGSATLGDRVIRGLWD